MAGSAEHHTKVRLMIESDGAGGFIVSAYDPDGFLCKAEDPSRGEAIRKAKKRAMDRAGGICHFVEYDIHASAQADGTGT